MSVVTDGGAAGKRGRPSVTSARELERVALGLFAERGFDATTVEDITARAGVGRRTFFRYFEAKAEVLWAGFDRQVEGLRAAFAEAPSDGPTLTVIREVVVRVAGHEVGDLTELATRTRLIRSVPPLRVGAAAHSDRWEQVVSDYAAARRRERPDDLIPVVIGRCAFAAYRAALDDWVSRPGPDLVARLDYALQALTSGFASPGLWPLRERPAAVRDRG